MGVKELFDLRGKVALVTGGSRGLGLTMAKALGEMGARVTLVARKANELAAAKAALEAEGIECLTIAGDLSQPSTIARIVDGVLADWGQIDILSTMRGRTGPRRPKTIPTMAGAR